jgi:steroid delta-isomerase-like uncharacterized protein
MPSNKDLYRRWISEVWSNGSVELIDELHADDFVDHSGLMGVTPDNAGMKQFIQGLHQGFPDLSFTVDDVVEEGDRVVGRWTMTGTHSQEFNGLPPTGNAVTLVGCDFLVVRDGRFVEIWHLEDNVAMLQALGLMPGPG